MAPEDRFHYGLRLVEEGYRMKMEEQSHMWMNRCNEQKMELEELKRKLEIKERQIVDLQQESSQLVEQRDALASKYTKLKGHVMQIQSLNNNFAAEEGFVGNKLANMNPNFAEQGGGGSSSFAPSSYASRPASPPRASSPPKNDIPQDNAPDAVDAISFYKQVKQVLEPNDFQDFAANIKALNAGQQSVEETVRKVLAIIGEERPFLRAKFQRLVYQNIDTSN
jgi:cell division protein FtsB